MNIYEIFCINELLISLICKVLWLKWHFVQKDYNNPEAGIHVPCWNYLYQCSSVTGGGIVPPTFFTRKFYDLPRKKGQGREMERKRRKIWKGRSGKLKMEGERYENEQRTSFYLFFIYLFIYLFCLSLFETTGICFGLPKWTILPGKIIFHAGKKSGNLTLPPLKNIPPTPLHRWKHRLWEPIGVLNNLFLFFLYTMVPKSIKLLFLSR